MARRRCFLAGFSWTFVSCAVLFFAASSRGQTKEEILTTILDARRELTSLHVHLEIADVRTPRDAKVRPSAPNPWTPTRAEAFFLSGENRRFEKYNYDKASNAIPSDISILGHGERGYQNLLDDHFLWCGDREHCPPSRFSDTNFGLACGWIYNDPTAPSEDPHRQTLACLSLEHVLVQDSYRVVGTVDGLVVVVGRLDQGIPLPEGYTPPVDRLFLDKARGYALVKRQMEVAEGVELPPDFVGLGDDGRAGHIRVNTKFKKLTDRLWTPTEGYEEWIEPTEHRRASWRAITLEANTVSDDVFNELLDPKSAYVDFRDPVLSDTGRPLVQRVAERPLKRVAAPAPSGAVEKPATTR